ncbi:MAG TPA: ribosome-associated translation inhibitor RaiA [Pyrinomonadaceae bacterium]|nr:ribosome-associated translation inhibitor RaiA [Pyrinomonadaceae bacterium]
MHIEYTGRHMDVTPAIRTHVEEHFRKLDHIFDGHSTVRAHVVIEVNKNRHIGEVIVHWREYTLTAKDINADMYQALTRAIDKIEKQAVKLMKKKIERKKGAPSLAALAPDQAAADTAPPPRTGRIISARRYAVKPMTAEEAALRLEAEDDQFLVFRDADTQRVSVLYKRRDGNFGLIQP